jgi:hypothetical protein
VKTNKKADGGALNWPQCGNKRQFTPAIGLKAIAAYAVKLGVKNYEDFG